MTISPNDTIRLTWRTKNKGKARISQCGEFWKVKQIRDKIICKDDQKGPWLLVEAVGPQWDLRWIHQFDDKDFEIIV